MLSNLHKNSLGTTSFDAKFAGMRKEQEFDVYPIGAGEMPEHLTIQSNTRFGKIDLASGKVFMSPSVASGAFAHHLAAGKVIDQLGEQDLAQLKQAISKTNNPKAGAQHIEIDNGGAAAAMRLC